VEQARAARREWLWASGAVGLSALPLLASLSNPIGGVDPPQYAEIGRELLEGHRWLPLRDAYGSYLDKPPLTFWLMRVVFALLGPTPLAARLPALLGLSLTVAALAWLGKRLYGGPTGLWAGALLLATPLVQLGVADPKIDLVLVGFLSMAIACAVASRDHWAWLVPAWLCAGFAFLTKGPVGLLLPAAALLPEVLRDERRGRSPLERLLGLRPMLGLLLVALMATPFYLSVRTERGPAGVRFLLWDQSFGRVFERGYHNPTGPFFFLHTLLWAALPATVALGFALVTALQSWRREGARLPPREDRIPLWWFAAGLTGISLSAYKLPQYLLWPMPGGLLWTASWVRTRTLGAARDSRFHRLQFATSIAVPVAMGGFAQWAFPGRGTALVAVGLIAVGLWILYLRGGVLARAFAVPLVSGCTTGLVLVAWIHPSLMGYDPGQVLGRAAREAGALEVLTFARDANPAIAFACNCRNRAVELSELVSLSSVRSVLVAAPNAAEPTLIGAGLTLEMLSQVDSAFVATPSLRFLNPLSRNGAVERWRLWRVSSGQAP
jgi:4-amino-4-deoxy-L-arabinose transferase-like glycosyltransferase